MEHPKDGNVSFALLQKPGPFLAIVICITGIACTSARLAFTKIAFDDRLIKIPAMCQGIIATIDYGSLTPQNAFILSSISNAIASITDNGGNTCQVTNFSFGDSDEWLHLIYRYLIVVSTLNLVWLLFPQPICWLRVFTQGCKRRTLRLCLFTSILISGLEGGSVYMSVRSGIPRLEGLSAAVL